MRISEISQTFPRVALRASFVIGCAMLLVVLLATASTPASAFGGATAPPTNTRLPTSTRTPPATKTATETRTPTITPTPPPTMVILGTYETPAQPPVAPIPLPLATPKTSSDDVKVVLLLGSDTITPGAASRTDVIVLVAIDRTAGTVSLMQIPRDMFVYAPNSTMVKINTVMNSGEVKYGAGGGVKLIEQTILYNFGIKIDYYAHIDFVQFEKLIGKLGGLDISVDCAIQGHRLKSPELDYNDPNSYELYTLPIGFHHLSPYMSLWYVRSRGSSSDFDRGRREIDVLRAIWHQAKSAGLLAQVTDLWPEAQKLIETDMSLADVLGFVPTALGIDLTNIQRVSLKQGLDFKVGPNLGSYGLLVVPDAMQTTVQNFLLPPPLNRLNGEAPTVEVGAALAVKGLDQVAADTLSWQGYAVNVLGMDGITNRDLTIVYDYTGNAKPSSLAALVKTLRINKGQVIEKPDPNRTVDFRVEMGHDYASCLYALQSGDGVTPQPK